jgi:hypothetical protein
MTVHFYKNFLLLKGKSHERHVFVNILLHGRQVNICSIFSSQSLGRSLCYSNSSNLLHLLSHSELVKMLKIDAIAQYIYDCCMPNLNENLLCVSGKCFRSGSLKTCYHLTSELTFKINDLLLHEK